jgi:hypothetical protein
MDLPSSILHPRSSVFGPGSAQIASAASAVNEPVNTASQTREQDLLGLCQQVVAPVDCGAQGLLP